LNSKILSFTSCLVLNQVRGFKTRHSGATGVGVSNSTPTTSTSQSINDSDVYRLSTVNSGKTGAESLSQYPNDSNQPPLASVVNRVRFVHSSSI